MKIPYYFLCACIVLALFTTQNSLFAQEGKPLDYIVLYTKDTLYGTVAHIDEKGIHRVFYKKIRITLLNGKRKRYNRKKVLAFRINDSCYESFWLSQSSQKIMLVNPMYDIDSKNGEQYFLRLVTKGALSHYELEWLNQGSATLWSMSLLRKENDWSFIRADQGLLGLKRKILLNYFFDCPILQEEIKNRQLTKVSQVVDFYNTNCMDK